MTFVSAKISTLFLSLLVVVGAFVSHHNVVVAAEESEANNYCMCTFAMAPENEPNCRVYGQLGDGTLIPWHRANQTCLDDLNIKVESMDPETLANICPYANHTDSNVNALISTMKNSPSPATRAIQAYYGDYWSESNVTAGNYEFHDVVFDSRQSAVDCAASESNCWGVVKEYFANTPDAMSQNCLEFHNRQATNAELEQSTARINLCNVNRGEPTPSCEPLPAQVQTIQGENPDKACSAFGLGPAGYAPLIPTAATCGGGSSQPKSQAVAASVRQWMSMTTWWTVVSLGGAMLVA